MVSLETDKAIVQVPSPVDGTVAQLMGVSGDVIHTGEALVEFKGEADDSGTVVGSIQVEESIQREDKFIIGSAPGGAGQETQCSSALDYLKMNAGLDVNDISGSGRDGLLPSADLERLWLEKQASRKHPDRLRGVRRHMAMKMKISREQVTPVTIFDQVDIHAWAETEDITIRLIKAIVAGCLCEPGVNAWYDRVKMTYKIHDHVDLGIAVDTEDGLFVPVLRNVAERDAVDLRKALDLLRRDVKNRSLAQSDLKGNTITLSNFGMIAGVFATPIITPPRVCIIGAGAIGEKIVLEDGNAKAHKTIPLSVTIDHQVLTGGEAARFLNAVKNSLEKASLN